MHAKRVLDGILFFFGTGIAREDKQIYFCLNCQNGGKVVT